jgi:hypothetical protein
MDIPHTRLGEGGFGLVFKPALNNVGPEGEPQAFPANVTKLFYNEKAYNKALTNASMLEEQIPNVAVPTRKYRKTYRVRNLPPSIASYIKSKNPALTNANMTFPVRMPDLGVSLHAMNQNMNKYAMTFAGVSTVTMARQVYKIMRQIKAINEAGYVHADIRETNMMINPSTGTLTLIDFDWLTPKREILMKYPRPFYSHPIETAFFLYNINRKYLKRNEMDKYAIFYGFESIERAFLGNEAMTRERFHANILRAIQRVMMAYGEVRVEYPPTYEKDAADFMVEIFDFYRSNRGDSDAVVKGLVAFIAKVVDTLDSFGLGICLQALIRDKFTTPRKREFGAFCETVLIPGLMHGNASKRMTIDMAIEALKEFATVTYPAVPLEEVAAPPPVPVPNVAQHFNSPNPLSRIHVSTPPATRRRNWYNTNTNSNSDGYENSNGNRSYNSYKFGRIRRW